MMWSRARAGSLAVLIATPCASAAASHRRLHQDATASLCTWTASTCALNSDLVASLGPLGDLGASEADLRACYDPSGLNASCSGEAPVEATVPATADGEAPTAVPAEAPAAGDVALAEDDVVLTPLTIEPDAAAAPVAAGAVQPWDAANPPDYSVPAQCPFDGHINPLTSGALPDEFKHKTAKDFEPFKPDDTPIEDDTICAAEGAVATEHARGKVLVKDGGTGLCTACPEAKCTIWVPHPDGWYKPECTGVAVLDDGAVFDLKFPMPGDEEEAGWGPDANPHVHFQCEGCGGEIWNKYYPTALESYCATSTVQNMLMSGPDESNVLHSVTLGSGEPGMFYIIMQDEWEMRGPNSAGAKCWAQKFGNPCPQFAEVGAACDEVDDPKPEPVIETPAPVAAAEPVEVCVLSGGNLDYPGAVYPDADSLTAADAAACAKACLAADGCDASVYLERPAAAGELPNCYLKEGLVTDAGTALPELADTPAPRTVALMQPCAGVLWAPVAPGGARRLAQAAAQCKAVPLADGSAVCLPADAMGTPAQLQTAQGVVAQGASFTTQCPMAALTAGTASPECRRQWLAYFNMAGCAECVADVQAVTAAAAACGAATSDQACSAASATAAQRASAAGSDMPWQTAAAPGQPPATPATAAQSGSGSAGQEQAPASPATAAPPPADGAAAMHALPVLAAAFVLGAALL